MHGNNYGNNSGMGSPSPLLEVAVPWDYRMPTALPSNRSWQVLILVELNHLLARCTLDALSELSWGAGTEFEEGG